MIFEKVALKSYQNLSLVYLYSKFGECKPQVPCKDMKNYEIKEYFALKSKENISLNQSRFFNPNRIFKKSL